MSQSWGTNHIYVAVNLCLSSEEGNLCPGVLYPQQLPHAPSLVELFIELLLDGAVQDNPWNCESPGAVLTLLLQPRATSAPSRCARAGKGFGTTLDFLAHGIGFFTLSPWPQWGDPGAAGCWTLTSPTQLLREVCKRRGIVQTFKMIPKRTPAGCSHAVGSVLQHPCSICVFPSAGAVSRLPGMNHGVLSACTPLLLASSQTGTFLPCSHTGTFTKKRKNAQSPLKSALWPLVNLPHPSSSLCCLGSSSPLLLPAPGPAAAAVSALQCFLAAQVPARRTEPSPWEPWGCSSGSQGLPWCRHFPG